MANPKVSQLTVHRIRSSEIRQHRHLVVVQPHLDDAVLSCFALMRASRQITVVTVFSGLPDKSEPPARYDRLTNSDNPRARMTTRRREDRQALRSLGARHRHLDLLDAPYRASVPTLQSIAEAVLCAIPKTATALALPAGIGGHADHVRLSAASSRIVRRSGIGDVSFYADYPYAALYGWPSWVTGVPSPALLSPEATWESALARLSRLGAGVPTVVCLEPKIRDLKLATFAEYRTQVAATEEGPSQLVSHRKRIPFEVFWTSHHA